MKKLARCVALIVGILLIVSFVGVVVYEYSIGTNNMVYPYPFWVSILLSVLVYLVPSAVCFAIAYSFRSKHKR